jgi:hypothetical protein
MKLKERIDRLESQIHHHEVIEFAFRKENESDEDAIRGAKLKFPNANKFIVVSWISTNEHTN